MGRILHTVFSVLEFPNFFLESSTDFLIITSIPCLLPLSVTRASAFITLRETTDHILFSLMYSNQQGTDS